MRYGDQHGIAQSAFDQALAFLEYRHIRPQCAACPFPPRLPAIRRRSDLDFRRLALQNRLNVTGAHVSHADDTQFDFFHSYGPLVFSVFLPREERYLQNTKKIAHILC